MISGVSYRQSISPVSYRNDSSESNNVLNDFEQILKAKNEKDMKAKEFLATLTPDELYAIQKAQNLAKGIDVSKLSDEGAENLFVLMKDKRNYVDLNNDGITEIGEGKTFIFPPPNAPDTVKDAWDKTTEGMTFKEKMLALSPFLAQQLIANSHKMPDGSFKVISPGEPGYVNIFGESTEDFCGLVNTIIERLKRTSNQLSQEEKKVLEFQLKALYDFYNNLNTNAQN